MYLTKYRLVKNRISSFTKKKEAPIEISIKQNFGETRIPNYLVMSEKKNDEKSNCIWTRQV